jgi:hypothetical protein
MPLVLARTGKTLGISFTSSKSFWQLNDTQLKQDDKKMIVYLFPCLTDRIFSLKVGFEVAVAASFSRRRLGDDSKTFRKNVSRSRLVVEATREC